MPTITHIMPACVLAIATSEWSAAQTAYAPRYPGTPPMLQRVDQAHSDVSALSSSLREVNMIADLRDPMGFQYVYHLPGRDDLLMRANGGVYVIFPQSEYVHTKKGLTPVVPAGAVFSIGIPSQGALPLLGLTGPTLQNLDSFSSTLEPLARNERRSMVMTAVSNRTVSRRDAEAFPDEWNADGAPDLNPQDAYLEQPQYQVVRAKPPEPSTFLKTVVTDDAVRNQRLAELLQQALRAAQEGG